MVTMVIRCVRPPASSTQPPVLACRMLQIRKYMRCETWREYYARCARDACIGVISLTYPPIRQ